MQLCGSLNIFWHCLSLGLEWKLTFSSPVATAEFSKFAGILSATRVNPLPSPNPGTECAQTQGLQFFGMAYPPWVGHMPHCKGRCLFDFTSLHFTALAPTFSVQLGRDLVAEGTCHLVGCTLMPSYGTKALVCLWWSVLALLISLYWWKQILSGKLNNTMMGWGGKEGRREGKRETGRGGDFVFLNVPGTFIPLFELWTAHFPFGLSSANYVAKPERAVRRHVEWGGLRHGTASSPWGWSVASWCGFL